MTEERQVKGESPWLKAVTILVVALFGFMFVGPLVGTFLALPFYEGSVFTFMEDLVSPFGNEEMKLIHYIVQGSATFIGLAVVPALYWRKASGQPISKLFDGPRATLIDIALASGIVFSFMVFNSIIIEWNANVDLPDFLGGFETWARQTEDTATALTKYLTEFSTFGQFIIGFIVIAVFAGIGEELVFRGMLQPTLHKATGNIHAAIWISSILFSCLHLQFYGFVPRVFLGALFGYLYFWSGNLIIPMIAHFVNNAFGVIMLYIGQSELAGVSLEDPEAAPWPVAAGFTVLTIAMLWYFNNRQALKKKTQ